MKIKHKLPLGFALLVGFLVWIGGIGIWKLHQVGNSTRQIVSDPLTAERLISDWSRNISIAVARTTAIAKSSDASLGEFFAADAAATTKSSSELIKKIEPLIDTEEEKALFDKISEIRRTYILKRDTVIKLKSEGQAEEAMKALENDYLPIAKRYQDVISEFTAFQRGLLDQEAKRASETEDSAQVQLAVLTLLAALVSMICAWRLTAGITRPLQNAVVAARRVADGDLTSEIKADSRDETGELLQALNAMNANLLKIVMDVRQGTGAIAVASKEIASGNLDLSSRTEQQAASLEETASSMEELTSTVNQNADNARQANQLAQSASQIAQQGGTVVSQVVETMGGINDSARKIVDIIGVIDGIAFQTNILALNAAVEAARAGEQGRGFAVVASEVRSLAQRSANAAKEIKSLIADSVDKVESGSRLVDQAGTTMEKVVASVRQVTDIIGEIAAASDEQRSGIEQVNNAITQMDQVTQQNAALVEQASAAAAAMDDQAHKLVDTVRVFKVNDALQPVQAAPASSARAVQAKPRPAAPATGSAVVTRPQAPAAVSRGKLPVAAQDDDWAEF